MIYTFSYQLNQENKNKNIKQIILISHHPLKEIDEHLKSIKDDDLIMFLPDNISPHQKYIEKTSELYNDNYIVLSLSPDDPEKQFVKLTSEKIKETDTILLKKKFIKRKIRTINSASSYFKIRKKISKFCGCGVYVPSDRTDFVNDKLIPNVSTTNPRYNNDIVNKDISSNVYKVKINLGIGDLLYTRAILDNLKKKFKRVHISPNLNVYKTFREPNNKDIDFTLKMMSLIFNDPYYIIDPPNMNYPERFAWTFSCIDRFEIVKPNLSDTLCEGVPLNIGPYICISTRFRELPIKEYNEQIKEKFIDIVKRLSNIYKIVLMGERKLLKYKEHDILKDRVYCMYDDLINIIPPRRLVDLTFNDLNSIDEDRIKKVKQECLYMRDAEYNITFGNGGSFCMATAVGRVIGYYTKNNPCDVNPFIFKHKRYSGVFVYDNINEFFLKLENILKEKPVFNMKVNMGFGDLLLIRTMMDNTKDRYSKIHITPNTEFFNKLRTTEYTNGYVNDYIKYLFDDPYYEIHNDLSYKRRNTETLWESDLIDVADPSYLSDILCRGVSLNLNKPYITITTKVRALKKQTYDLFKTNFYNTLKTLSNNYKIVILGERELPIWPEYKENDYGTFVIYNDIINNIPKENLIDLSFNLNDEQSLSKLMQDCLYMKEAYYNITIGMGGGFCLALMSGRIIGLWEEDNRPSVTDLYNKWCQVKSNAYLTTSIDKFIYWISEIKKPSIIEQKTETKNESKIIPKQTNILQFRTYMGLGDLIHDKIFLNAIENDYDKIHISPSKEIIRDYRDNDMVYYNFCKDILHMLFNTDKYVIEENEDFEHMDGKTFATKMKITPTIKNHDLTNYLCNISTVLPATTNKYIVLTTKVRSLDRSIYENIIKKGFWNYLNNIQRKYSIVILGEREMGLTTEYKQSSLTNNTFCIYDDIMKNINKINLIDLSVPELGITTPDISNIKNDCYIMKNAKGVICFGIGGNFCMSSVVSKQTISIRSKEVTSTIEWLYDINKNKYPHIHLVKTPEQFIECVSKL